MFKTNDLAVFVFSDDCGEHQATIDPASTATAWAIVDPNGRVLVATIRPSQEGAESVGIEHLGLSGMEMAERGYSRQVVCVAVGAMTTWSNRRAHGLLSA